MSEIANLLSRLDQLSEEDREKVQKYLSNKWPTMSHDKEVAAFIAEAESIQLPTECENETQVVLPSAIKKSEYIPGKRGRRKGQVDTNSARQRVFCAVRRLLKDRELHCHELWDMIQEETNLSYEVVRANAFQCPGVHRAEYWSLEAA